MANDRITAAGWKIVLLASLGGTLEFYDFVIFGVFARDIAQAVFPASDPIVGLVLSFATFAVGYLARPIGGIVLSQYGDRFGRRARAVPHRQLMAALDQPLCHASPHLSKADNSDVHFACSILPALCRDGAVSESRQ